MRPLSAQDAPRVWESARGQHGVDRAITLLATACPDMTRHDLASLSLGQRDARLLTLRERTFGPQLDGLADCPNCEEQLQISLAVSDIRVAQENQADAEPMELKANGLRAPFRLPNSSDLAAAAHCRMSPLPGVFCWNAAWCSPALTRRSLRPRWLRKPSWRSLLAWLGATLRLRSC